ncbi:little elongation complex subunit 1, partial [Silurus meridionalis]
AWPSLFSIDSPLCRAIHICSKLKARGNILDLLSKYLHWNEDPPEKIYSTITSTLKALLEDSSLTFQKNSWYGDDLCPAAWDYVFSLDLLCAQLGWTWTYKNMLGNDIWQTLDTLLLQTRTEQTPYRNVSVAAVFRLLGRLGQLGLKKNMAVSVRNLLKGIHEFGNRKLSKDLPWEVQLAMVYATHDLAPSNPKVALKTVESWRQKIRQPVPLAVTKCLEQIGFL